MRSLLLVHAVLLWLGLASTALAIDVRVIEARNALAIGDHARALNLFDKLLLDTEAGRLRNSFVLERALALLYLDRVDESEASLASLKSAIGDDYELLAREASTRGQIALSRAEYSEGHHYLLSGVEYAQRGSESDLIAHISLNALRAASLARIPLVEIESLAAQTAERISRQRDISKRRLNSLSLVDWYLDHMESGLLSSGQAAVRDLLAKIATDGPRDRDDTQRLGLMGRLAALQGELENARALTQRAVFQSQNLGNQSELYRWQWQLARILKKQRSRDQAIEAYRQAIATLDPLRPGLLRLFLASGVSYRQRLGALYAEALEILLEDQNDLSSSRLAEAQSIAEKVKVVELEDYLREECFTQSDRSPQEPTPTLGANSAVLYPIILNDRLELLLTTPDGVIQRHTSRIPRADLEQLLREFRLGLEKRTTRQYLEPGKKLYELMFAPVVDELRRTQISTLFYVPDGPLRSVPLAALHNGESFVAEEFAVVTSPALRLSFSSLAKRPEPRALVAAIASRNQGYPALPFAQEEAEMIAALFGGRLLSDESFSREAVAREVATGGYSILHIASHGEIAKDVRNSFILSADGKISLNDLSNMVRKANQGLGFIELVSLSACRTAVGDDRAALGLAGVAIKAGARSALASLWYVNDEASSDLMRRFYRNRSQSDQNLAVALQSAQRALLKETRTKHPSYWAPFLLIGSPQ